MTYLTLIMSGGRSGGATPPPPPDDPGLDIPAALDATHTSMRPAGRLLGTLRVSPTHPDADYPTIGSAIVAAKALQTAAGKQDAVAWNPGGVIGPDYRVDVIVGPGTYNEHIGGGDWIPVYGSTGDPADVVVSDNASDDGTWHTFGPSYLEGITLLADGPGPKYPLHLGAKLTTSLVNCALTATSSAGAGGGAAVGMDGADGSDTSFYRCTLNAGPGASWAANMHSNAAAAAPLTLAFVDSDIDNVVDYSDLGTHQADQVYFIGTTGGGTLSVSGTNVGTHTTGPWPTPDPLSAADADYFYPSQIATPHTQGGFTVTDAATFSPVANRTYLVPVPIDTAIHATHYGITASASGGSWVGWMGHIDGPPTGAPALTPGTSIGSAGLKEGKHYYYYDFYPGEEVAWVAVKFSSGAHVMGSVSLPGIADCYYTDDGTTIVHASVGTAIPLVQIRSAS